MKKNHKTVPELKKLAPIEFKSCLLWNNEDVGDDPLNIWFLLASSFCEFSLVFWLVLVVLSFLAFLLLLLVSFELGPAFLLEPFSECLAEDEDWDEDDVGDTVLALDAKDLEFLLPLE